MRKSPGILQNLHITIDFIAVTQTGRGLKQGFTKVLIGLYPSVGQKLEPETNSHSLSLPGLVA